MTLSRTDRKLNDFIRAHNKYFNLSRRLTSAGDLIDKERREIVALGDCIVNRSNFSESMHVLIRSLVISLNE